MPVGRTVCIPPQFEITLHRVGDQSCRNRQKIVKKDTSFSAPNSQGCEARCFGKRGPCRKFYPQKQGFLLLRPRKPTKMTKMAGVTQATPPFTFESLLSNFWVTLAGSPKVTFESPFCVFEFSGVWGSVGEMAGHKLRNPDRLSLLLHGEGSSETMARWELSRRCHNLSEGPKSEKNRDFAPGLKLSSAQSQIEIFNRDWKFQARLKIRPLLWEMIKVGIEIFKRGWSFSIEIENFKPGSKISQRKPMSARLVGVPVLAKQASEAVRHMEAWPRAASLAKCLATIGNMKVGGKSQDMLSVS